MTLFFSTKASPPLGRWNEGKCGTVVISGIPGGMRGYTTGVRRGGKISARKNVLMQPRVNYKSYIPYKGIYG